MSEYIPPIQPLLASTRGTTRRMKIYFQPRRANENDPPVAPAIDSDIDIAVSNKKKYIEYAVDRSTNATENNPTPLSPEIVDPEEQDEAQKTYINQVPNLNYSGIPNAFNVFNHSPTMFDDLTLTSVGVPPTELINTEEGAKKGYYAGNVGRPFAIRKYVGQLNALETSDPDSPDQINAHHNKLVDAQLLKFRGANSQNKYVPPAGGDPETRDNSIPIGNMFYQGELGKFAVGTYVRQDTSKATPLTIEQLKQVGLNIVFNSVGGDILNRESSIKTTSDAALAELALVTPIGPRIGQKVKLSRFSAASEAEKLFGAKKINSTAFIDTDKDVDSYGSFNNPFSQFDSLVSIGQIAVSTAMILTFVVFLGSISAIVNAFSSDRTSLAFATSGRPTRLVKGSSTLYASPNEENKVYPSQVSSNVGDFLIQMMNLGNIFSKPKHQFEDCLAAGMEEFFGLTPNSGGLMRIMTESGRLNVILRELIRNGVDLGESAAAVFTGTGAASPIAGVLGFFKSLTELKIIKFINVLVAIGDKALEGQDRNINIGIFSITNIGGVDSLPDIGFKIQKSRLRDGTLVWSTTTSPYYSLGLRNIGFQSKLQSELNLEIKTPPNLRNDTEAISGRLPSDKVKQIENSLESDYMPFYFHDLRTNEIMSFHAFLENTSEDFNIEYTAQEGYGRMDKVQIYKGTTRNITVDFKMIATNEVSHDDMWYKINRLAMMIYPQWTQGRQLNVGALKFIQPFSQIPGATPVIRLRLGDLYKSNYSKMAVARLFGASTRSDYDVTGDINAQPRNAVESQPHPIAAAPATPPAPIPPAPTPPGAATPSVGGSGPLDEALFPDIEDIAKDIGGTTPGGIGWSYNPRFLNLNKITSENAIFTTGPTLPRRRGHVAKINPNDIFISGTSKIVLDVKRRVTRNFLHHIQDRIGLDLAPSVTEDQRTQLRDAYNHAPDSMQLYCTYEESSRNSVKLRPKKIVLFNLEPSPYEANGSTVPELRSEFPMISARPLEIDINSIKAMMDLPTTSLLLLSEIRAAANPAAATPAAATGLMQPRDFYDDTKNPILKAFNSTAGKGLAGVITSFKVDYKESDKRWGIDFTNKLRAPMYVTISVTMAVIHDIPLGLDSNGIMNAPIWPVGNSSNYFMRNERPQPTRAPPGPNTVDPPREIRLTADEM